MCSSILLQFISEYKLLDHSKLATQQKINVEIQYDRKEKLKGFNNMMATK